MKQLPQQPVELTYLLPNGKPDLSKFKGTPEHYANYFAIFQEHGDSKNEAAANLAFNYLSMGAWGLLAVGPAALTVLPGILKRHNHPWIRESVAFVFKEFMSDDEFQKTFIDLVKTSQDEESAKDIVGILATCGKRQRSKLLELIEKSEVSEEIKRFARDET